MKLKLDFTIDKSHIEFSYHDSALLIGSCFSDEIGQHFLKNGFRAEINPFGTLFHPTAIANVLKASIEESTDVSVYHRDDLFFSWDAASKVYAYSEAELIQKIIETRQKLRAQLLQSRLLVITFGTAWQYAISETSEVVGNCHKAPQNLFSKALMPVDEMHAQWQPLIAQLKTLNPTLEIVFTVSPVRHIKDGIVENNRSKSRLIELAHTLVNVNQLNYFPSYEILIDELRDYRFYQSDLVHPSDEAVNYVWKSFAHCMVHPETLELMSQRSRILGVLNHSSLHPESNADIEGKNKAMMELELYKGKYPEVGWE